MSTPLPFSNNLINVYAYEGFSYTISNPDLTYTLQTVSNSSGFGPSPSALYFTKNGNTSYTFAITDSSTNLTAGRTESFVLQTISGSLIQTSSNTVKVNPGRFLVDPNTSLSNNVYTYYKNEANPPIRLVAPSSISLKQPTSIPTLPPGLSFVKYASNIYDITGIPLVTVPNSNYQIIGVEEVGSKVVTTKFNLVISNERLRLNLNGSPIISNMLIGTPIVPRTFTVVPPEGSGSIRYTFPILPDGITATDSLGNAVTSPFPPADLSYTMIIQGTPTEKAAEAFRNAGVGSNGATYTIQALRTIPSTLSNSLNLTFAFGETVLFDTPVLQTLYVGVPLVSNDNFFRAATYFTSNVPIVDISSTSLPTGLTIVFDASLSRGNLVGTPSTAGAASYTIRATNSNAILRDYVTPITILNDSVSFVSPSPSNDSSYRFILSRPVDQAKDSYYTYPITFAAEAGSKLPVVLSAPGLAGTGLSLSNGTIVGTPSTILPATNVSINASVTGSPATASRTIQIEILNDEFYFGSVASSNFAFIQNIPFTPFQIPVTTLSGRNVINFTTYGGPTGVVINPGGVVSGTPLSSTPTSGNFSVVPTTGYASGLRDFSYTLFPDNILLTVPNSNYVYTAGGPLSIQVTGTAYSGANVSQFTLTSLYGPTINATTGLIGGNWSDSIPPNPILPETGNLTIGCSANNVTDSLVGTFTTFPTVKRASFAWSSNTFYTYNDVSWTADPKVFGGTGFDIVIKNTDVNGNFVVGTASNVIYRSSTINEFVPYTTDQDWCSTLAFNPSTSTWWCSGLRLNSDSNRRAAIVHSENNADSWDFLSFIETDSNNYLLSRDSNSNVGNAYLRGGIALEYAQGVLMAGGVTNDLGSPVMLRSTDEGVSWRQDIIGAFEKETASFNLENPTLWVATGSSGYKSIDNLNSISDPVFTSSTSTIKYSTDQGQTWSNASGAFNMFGYELIYANNTWVATGVDYASSIYTSRLKYSTNGVDWINATPFVSDISSSLPFIAPLPLGSINYDGSNWNLFRTDQLVTKVYSSPSISNGYTAWTSNTSTLDACGNPIISYTRPQYLRTTTLNGSPDIQITLSFNLGVGAGPLISSPSIRSFLLYQYIPVSIQLAAAHVSGNVYFFITNSELPPGLTFNPLTNLITGKPADTGQYSTRVFAQDASGITVDAFDFTIQVPRVLRKQDGAGAYTSLLKQYTEVLAAQSARDQRVLPNQETRLGEFMSPIPPAVITQTFSTDCAACPVVGIEVIDVSGDVVVESSIGAFTTITTFIDASAGEVFDAGSA